MGDDVVLRTPPKGAAMAKPHENGMNFDEAATCVAARVSVRNLLPQMGKDTVIRDILNGLIASPRRISSMFFYDAVGSALFDRITELPEYYPSRTEMALLGDEAASIAQNVRDIDIVELGSGSCAKITILLNAIDSLSRASVRYVPVDVSAAAIEESANELAARFPELVIEGIVADFITQLSVVPARRRRLFCFFGSTIGNLTPVQRSRLLAGLGSIMRPDDQLLLGVDMVKPREILERAYNDAGNVTATFNRNILNVVNSIVGTDFDPDAFGHVAFYDDLHSRIEMHLKATDTMTVHCPHPPH
ncbi:MAG: L-histidine N(alpha)-methyltransferase, partial [Chitinivibrionales bacterium]|nr:L-histidine N(alpha)-methyltransferase [Chitinivibrionales bacterium]